LPPCPKKERRSGVASSVVAATVPCTSWRRRGLLHIHYGGINVLNIEGLRAYVREHAE